MCVELRKALTEFTCESSAHEESGTWENVIKNSFLLHLYLHSIDLVSTHNKKQGKHDAATT